MIFLQVISPGTHLFFFNHVLIVCQYRARKMGQGKKTVHDCIRLNFSCKNLSGQKPNMCVNKMMSNDGSCIDKINIYKHMSRAKVFLKGYARFYSSKQGVLGANDENTIKIWNLLKGSRQKI